MAARSSTLRRSSISKLTSSAFKCLQVDNQDEEYCRVGNDMKIPIIAIVNGLSGGRKGEKVLETLQNHEYAAFDLMQLSLDRTYYRKFVDLLATIYDDIMVLEAKHMANNRNIDDEEEQFQLHPRICIGGGDGSMAWALSTIDRVFLEPELIQRFYKRCCLRNGESLPNDDDSQSSSDSTEMKEDQRRKLSDASPISEEFFYGTTNLQPDDENDHNHDDNDLFDESTELPRVSLQLCPSPREIPTITPFHKLQSDANTFDYEDPLLTTTAPLPHTVHVIREQQSDGPCLESIDTLKLETLSDDVRGDITPFTKDAASITDDDSAASKRIQKQIDTKPSEPLLVPNHDDNDDNGITNHVISSDITRDEDYASSDSESAKINQEQIIEDFMNRSASVLNPDQIQELEPPPMSSNLQYQTRSQQDRSPSYSQVTQEEFLSMLRGKENIAKVGQTTPHHDLRILQGIYDSAIGPAIALIPLGTGNDLSRCLGTGFTFPGTKQLIHNLLPECRTSSIAKLDRWKIEFLDRFGKAKSRQTSEFLCYFSVGILGQISYSFDQARSKNPKLFDRPWKNKMKYTLSGMQVGVDEVLGRCKSFNESIQLIVDGEPMKLPSNTKSLVVSSIQSMADGVYFWGKGPNTKKDLKTYQDPTSGDGKLEVMAAKGLYKYIQTRLGVSHYRRLAQPKTVQIVMNKEFPIQVDGESWIETEGTIKIRLLHQVFAVVGKNEPRGVRIL